MISIPDAVALLGAGMLAGLVGTAGAITSLVSYPALLAVGLAARAADVANIVALVACWPGSALASRPELRGWVGWLGRYAPVAAAGGGLGAGLLLLTPPGAFVRVVPFLVAAGSLTLLAAPRLTARRGPSAGRGHRPWLGGALLLAAVYNGYFGAGSGVMVLGLVLIALDAALPVANALKNMLIGVATAVPAAAFIAFGPVSWSAVLPLAAGMFLGGLLGPRVARVLPADLLRWVVALIGIGLAIQLWLGHGG
jgi:uncharacterized membrane protein YfcA